MQPVGAGAEEAALESLPLSRPRPPAPATARPSSGTAGNRRAPRPRRRACWLLPSERARAQGSALSSGSSQPRPCVPLADGRQGRPRPYRCPSSETSSRRALHEAEGSTLSARKPLATAAPSPVKLCALRRNRKGRAGPPRGAPLAGSRGSRQPPAPRRERADTTADPTEGTAGATRAELPRRPRGRGCAQPRAQPLPGRTEGPASVLAASPTRDSAGPRPRRDDT